MAIGNLILRTVLLTLIIAVFSMGVNAQCSTSSIPVPEGIIDLGNGSVSYWWAPILGTVGYQLEITPIGGSTITLQGGGQDPISAYYSGYPNGMYTWRVRLACDLSPLTTTQWSELDTFEVVLVPGGVCDATLAPAHLNEVLLTSSVNMHWHPQKNAKGCIFELESTTSSFSVSKLQRGGSLTNITIPYSSLDASSTCYQWRVQCGCSPSDLSPFSPYMSFCTTAPRLASPEDVVEWTVWSMDGRLVMKQVERIEDVLYSGGLNSGLYLFSGVASNGEVVKTEYRFIQ